MKGTPLPSLIKGRLNSPKIASTVRDPGALQLGKCAMKLQRAHGGRFIGSAVYRRPWRSSAAFLARSNSGEGSVGDPDCAPHHDGARKQEQTIACE